MFDPICFAMCGGNSGGAGGLGLPVVELTTKINTSDFETPTILSEAEGHALDAAFETGMPCVISITPDGIDNTLTFVFGRFAPMDSEASWGGNSFSGMYFHPWIGLLCVDLQKNGTGWEVWVSIPVTVEGA